MNFVSLKLAERSKKQVRASVTSAVEVPPDPTMDVENDNMNSTTIDGSKALPWLQKYSLVPGSHGLNTSNLY